MFLKEFKKTVMSITYFIFVAVMLLFGYTQIGTSFDKIEPPQPGSESYGMKYEEIPETIMPNAIDSIYREFSSNSYTAYPLGFYKNVKLNDKRKAEMAEVLSELTGIPLDEMMSSTHMNEEGITIGENDKVIDKNDDMTVVIPKKQDEKVPLSHEMNKNMTYERFLELMKRADKLIGGGSKYSNTYLIRFGEVPKTYEDAVKEYKAIVEKDKITGALARLFCDYLGIVLSVFPVFVAVAVGLKDRRAKMQELVYTRKISSFKLIFSRYFAMVIAIFLPVLLLAIYASIQSAREYTGFDLDLFAFIKYSSGWLLPTIMVSTAVGVCMTELTDTPVAIIVQGIWWFIGMNMGIRHIDGGYGADLAIRHNIVGNTQVYEENFNSLLMNRISYSLFAIALIAVAVLIYELKRRGELDVPSRLKKIFSHRKVESEA